MRVQDAAALLIKVEELLDELTSLRIANDSYAASEGDARCRAVTRKMVQSLRGAENSVRIASTEVQRLVTRAEELRRERRSATLAEALLATDNQ